jgi:DNA-binding CsgD family transcriptional regulator
MSWPLVGREQELGRIAAARHDPAVRAVVVTAPLGVGKSRLARAALAAAEADGALVTWVHGTRSAASVPLGALAALIPADLRFDDALELMCGSVRALREQAGARPIVLGVDDAHLLDAASAALVLHLTETGTAFVVATVRTAEECPDAVQSLWKDQGAVRLDLQPLTEGETGTLIESVLGGPAEEAARRWVFDSSQGNALFVRELLLGGLASGAVSRVAGLWRLSSRPRPSRALSELVTSRLKELRDEVSRAIGLLALGEPLQLAEAVELIGTAALADAESCGMVVIAPLADGGEVRLAHPLYGEVMRARMPAARAREARLRLAATVQPRTPVDALRAAHWMLDAGEPVPMPLLVEAARAANLAGDAAFGARLAGLALEAGAGADAALLLARALTVRKRYAEADAVLAGAEKHVETCDTAAEYLQQRVDVLFWGLTRPVAARALLARARAWWPEPAWRARLESMDLQLQTLTEGFAGSLAAWTRIQSDPALGDEARRALEPAQAAILFYSGHAREACDLTWRIRPPVPLPRPGDEFTLMLCSVIVLETGEDWPGLEAWGTDVLRAGVRANDHVAAGVGAFSLGYLSFLAGRFADASRWLAEAEVQFEQHDSCGALFGTWTLQVGAACATGDTAAAEEVLRRCQAARIGLDPPSSLKAYLARAQAWLACAQGDPGHAQKLLLDAAADVADMPLYAAQLSYEAMRAGAPAVGLAGPLEDLRKRCDARLVAAYAGHVAARAAGDGPALLRAAEEFADIGALWYAMESAAQAAGTFAGAGRPDSARRAAARSRELYAYDQGGPPPQISGVDTADTALTPREAQLVDFAARGLTNSEIADRLVLSVRTVESHLYRAMQKRGVTDRRELLPATHHTGGGKHVPACPAGRRGWLRRARYWGVARASYLVQWCPDHRRDRGSRPGGARSPAAAAGAWRCAGGPGRHRDRAIGAGLGAYRCPDTGAERSRPGDAAVPRGPGDRRSAPARAARPASGLGVRRLGGARHSVRLCAEPGRPGS